jgi:hypothetical protein
MLVLRCAGLREISRGVLAPGKRDGAGSSRVGVAHHGQRSVFRSMLGLGRTRTDTNDRAGLAPGDGIYLESKTLNRFEIRERFLFYSRWLNIDQFGTAGAQASQFVSISPRASCRKAFGARDQSTTGCYCRRTNR